MSWQAFAIDRAGRGDRGVELLMPLAAAWLDNFSSDAALGALVDAGTDIWLDGFTERAPQAYIDAAVGTFREMIGEYLAKTTEPEPDHDAQTRRVAVWLATVATNDSAWHGFQASGGLRMRWVSRKDEKVRTTHRAAGGQIRSVLNTFDVGGAQLRYPGDPRGPLHEVMECRCVLAPAGRIRTRRNGMTAAGSDDFDERPYALVTLLPADEDVNAASSEDIAHMTFIRFGEPGDNFDTQSIAMDVKMYARDTTPITVPVRERGTLGDDEADVLFLEPTESLLALRDGLMDHPAVREAHDAVEQYPEWTPHVTLGYPEAPALAEYDGDEITFDRFALWVGNNRMEFPMGQQIAASAAVDVEVEDPETEIPEDVDIDDEDLVDDVPIEIPVHGVATIAGKPTGDGRAFALGGLTNRPLPLPIRYEFIGAHGGDTSMVAPVGRIDEVWMQPVTNEAGESYEEMRYRGVIITTKEHANAALEGIADGSLTGVSVETDEISVDVEEERERMRAMLKADAGRPTAASVETEDHEPAPPTDEEIEALLDAFIGDGTMPVTVFSSARVCGFTIVPIPAFHEGYIALGHAFADELSEDDKLALAACGCYQPDEGDDENIIRGEDAFREISEEDRKRLADEGKALPDGSFPIENVDDLKNAIQAIGRASDPAAAKAHIKKRAKALGHEELIPEDWSLYAVEFSERDDDGPRLIGPFDSADAANEWLGSVDIHAYEASVVSVDEPDGLVAAAFAPGTKDGPGWITHPRATARIRRYWVKGKGAAKIKWGAPGDFNRCRTQLAKYVQNPDWLAGLCANMHKEALGFWPGEHHSSRGLTASGEKRETHIDPFMRLVEPDPEPMAIVAGAGWPDFFPADAFRNPELTEPTPITFTKDGRVYGHIATWDACHIGIDGICQNPPASSSDYRYFRKGVIDTDEGEITVGNITFGTGHIGLRATASQATAHYDKPSAVRAYVATGEDVFGIWFAGVVKPGLRKDDIAEFKALGAVSGDWRYVKGALELVGVTAVNVNGFQLERRPTALVAAANGHQTALIPPPVVRRTSEALVASATVGDVKYTVVDSKELAGLARAAAREVLHEQAVAPRIAKVREVRQRALANRIERVRAARESRP